MDFFICFLYTGFHSKAIQENNRGSYKRFANIKMKFQKN